MSLKSLIPCSRAGPIDRLKGQLLRVGLRIVWARDVQGDDVIFTCQLLIRSISKECFSCVLVSDACQATAIGFLCLVSGCAIVFLGIILRPRYAPYLSRSQDNLIPKSLWYPVLLLFMMSAHPRDGTEGDEMIVSIQLAVGLMTSPYVSLFCVGERSSIWGGCFIHPQRG